MSRLAIIGTGIAGMGAAYYLRQDFDLTVFEKNDYVGGHTNTVECDEGDRLLPIDTGFIVYNETTYPHLTRLFAEFGVRTQPSDMSFGVYNQNRGLCWAGHGWNGIFAQRRNALSPRFWKLLLEANRFNQSSVRDLAEGRADLSLGDYLQQNGYDPFFCENYIIPMGSAVWSTPLHRMLDFPAAALIRFFENHGFLGYHGQLSWRTVTGGSQEYMRLLVDAVGRDRIRRRQPALAVREEGGGVVVRTEAGDEYFDSVLIATHADEALALLERPTDLQERLLSSFRYEANQAILHTDTSVMAPTRRAWASWNYKISGAGDALRTSVIYYMNRLQSLQTDRHYFVSLNDLGRIRDEYIIGVFDYEHPLFDRAAMRAQAHLGELNATGPIFFAGSYFRNGFHEDALWSGIQAAASIKNAQVLPV